MRLEIKTLKKGDVVACVFASLLCIALALLSVAIHIPNIAVIFIVYALFTIGFCVYTYASTGTYLIDKYGIHIYRYGKEVNLLPWNLVKTIGYQREGHGRYFDFLYVSMENANRTRKLIETAQLYGGLLGSKGKTLNSVLLRKQVNLDITKLGAKLLILGPQQQLTMENFNKLRLIQIASTQIYGGNTAESLYSLEAKNSWPFN